MGRGDDDREMGRVWGGCQGERGGDFDRIGVGKASIGGGT